MAFDVSSFRQEFPILGQSVSGHPLVYLDSAATNQKPETVIDAMNRFYREENGSAHRGMHALSEIATERYEQARGVVQRFLHAARPEEIWEP